mgnify:FL=1
MKGRRRTSRAPESALEELPSMIWRAHHGALDQIWNSPKIDRRKLMISTPPLAPKELPVLPRELKAR